MTSVTAQRYPNADELSRQVDWPAVLRRIAPELGDALDAGANRHVHCPLPRHDDHRPSFRIDIAERKAHCTCGHYGLFDLVMELRGVDFKAAKDLVAEAAGYHQSRNGRKPLRVHATTQGVFDAMAQAKGGTLSDWGPWEYHDESGQVTGYAVRIDLPDGDKAVMPCSCVDGGWAWKAMPEPRPLYRLGDLGDADTVFVVEGEKAADVGRTIGLAITTSSGGSSAPHKTAWGPLAGKAVVILPDNDEPGEKYANAVAQLATDAGATSVRVVRLEGLGEGGDLFDWAEQHDAIVPEELQGTLLELAAECDEWQPATDESERSLFDCYSLPELFSLDLREDYMVPGVLVAGELMVAAAPEKTLKTSLVGCDLGISIATGTPFLGRFEVPKPRRVMFMSAESGLLSLRRCIARVLESKGFDAKDPKPDSMFISPAVPNAEDIRHIDAAIDLAESLQIDVLLCDPWFMCHSGEFANSPPKMYSILMNFVRPCLANEITPVIVTHSTKAAGKQGDPLDLNDISGAGIHQAMRQWILLSRREDYADDGIHKLWMRCGGSAGHSALWGIDVNEGIHPNRKWDVDVIDARDAIQQRTETQATNRKQAKADRQAAEDAEVRDLIFRAMTGDHNPDTRRQIRERTVGENETAAFKRVFAGMLRTGELVESPVQRRNRNTPYDGYLLVRKDR